MKQELNQRMSIKSISRTLATVVSVMFLSGCYPTFEQPRYYQLDMSIEMNGQTIAIQRNWHCYTRMEWSEGDGKFHKMTNYSGDGGIIRKIAGDGILFMKPPACLNPKDYSPSLMIVRSVTKPSNIEIYDQQHNTLHGSIVMVKSNKIRELGGSADDSSSTPEELKLMESLQKNSHGFQFLTARIWPEATWRISNDLSRLLDDKNTFTVAKEMRTPNGGLGYFQFPHRDIFFGIKDTDELKTFTMSKEKDVWKIAENPQEAVVAYAVNSDVDTTKKWDGKYGYDSKVPSAVVEYEGNVVQVENLQQVYDPSKKIIIDFINRYQERPWMLLH